MLKRIFELIRPARPAQNEQELTYPETQILRDLKTAPKGKALPHLSGTIRVLEETIAHDYLPKLLARDLIKITLRPDHKPDTEQRLEKATNRMADATPDRKAEDWEAFLSSEENLSSTPEYYLSITEKGCQKLKASTQFASHQPSW